MATIQAIEGYACSCGFKTDNKKTFTSHLVSQKARKDGHQAHHSLGRINLLTGEITMPPYNQRNLDQVYESKYGKKRPPSDILSEPPPPEREKKPAKPGAGTPTVSGTEIISQATQLRFIPRVFTTNLTPIMLLGYEVAIRKWGWRPDMPFENYLDTVIFNYTLEHGTQLQGAVTIFDEDEEPDNGHEVEVKEEPKPKEA